MKMLLTGFMFTAMAGIAMAQDVIIVGEVHDNLYHHQIQASIVRETEPKALVFEMLSSEQAALITPELYDDPQQLAEILAWDASGWPDFEMYFPIFTNASDATVFGAAIPRNKLPDPNASDLETSFAKGVYFFGSDRVTDADEQQTREELQHAAHCNALPASMLPYMVNVQRMRDAAIATAVLQAFYKTDGPVVVITGNGHARRDWGVPAYLTEWAPDLKVKVIGLTEDDAPLEGGYDQIISTSAVARPDPCTAFR